MNRKQAKELAPIITAFGDGKEIEIRCGNEWIHLPFDISFDDPPENYRIKPEPPEPRVLYVGRYIDGSWGFPQDTAKEARLRGNVDKTKPVVKFIEVIK